MKKTGVNKVNKIKIFALLALIILLTSFVVTVVSAAPDIKLTTEDIKQGLQPAGGAITTFLGNILNPFFAGESVALRFMIGILLFLLVWNVIPYIIDNKWIAFFASIIIAYIGFYSIPANFMQAITAHFGVMGATLLSIVPFIIIFVTSIRVANAMVARVIWLFYCIFYFAIYLYLTINVFQSAGTWYWAFAETIPHIAAIIIGIIMFFFIGVIRNIIFKGEMSALAESGERIIERGALLHKLQKGELTDVYGTK